MDIALCIEKLIPQAKYGGSVTDNSKKSYDALRWEDERKKPTWEQIVDIWKVIESEPVIEPETTEQLVERKIKEMVKAENLKDDYTSRQR